MQLPNLVSFGDSQKVFQQIEPILQCMVSAGTPVFVIETNLSTNLRWINLLQHHDRKCGSFDVHRLNLSLSSSRIFGAVKQVVLTALGTHDSVLFIDDFTKLSKVPEVSDFISQLVAFDRKNGMKLVLAIDGTLSASIIESKILDNLIMLNEGAESWPEYPDSM